MFTLEECKEELAEALAERNSLDSHIAGLEAIIRVQQMHAPISLIATAVVPGYGTIQYAAKMLDLCEMVLKQAGRPLSPKEIACELEKIGRPTSPTSITGGLPQDGMNRFEAIRHGIWALREWSEETTKVWEVNDKATEREAGKNPVAVAMGKLGGLKGGPARAAKMSPERRQEISRKAAEARWGKR